MKAAAVTSTVPVFFKLFLLLFESQQKPQTSWGRGKEERAGPDEQAGIFSLGLFWWMNPLLRLGSRRVLQLGDLYSLHSALTCATRDAESDRNSRSVSKTLKPGKLSALILIARAAGLHAFLPVLPRLVLSGFTLAQSLLVRRILQYLSDEQQRSAPNIKYGLIGATFLVYLGIALSTSVFGYLHERALTQLRGYLIQNVYRHATKMPPKAEGDRKKVITLVTADVEGIYNGLRNAHELWVVPVQTAFAVWLAYREVGPASLCAVGLIVVSCLGVAFLSPRVVTRQQAWMKSMQARISKTSDVLSSIKGLRMAGLSSTAIPIIQEARDEELRRGGYFRLMIALSATVSLCPAILAPVIVFAAGPRLLDATKAFTTLSYLNIMTQPLGIFIQVVPIVLASLVNLQRIEEFLISPPHTDYRLLLTPGQDGRSIAARYDSNVPEGVARAVEIRDASFRWSSDSGPVLRNVSLDIPKACFAVVTGPVGSGKTTLLQAIIGETAAVDGTVVVGTHRIAYCCQVPYLPRETIRTNIIGDRDFNQDRYEQVLAATSLVTDLRQLPLGDETKLDGRGDVLSGGQKHRVALARALYQPADLLIADDVLSGLDKETESVVFQRVFGLRGLLRRRGATVIMCTNSAAHAEMAEMQIALEVDDDTGSKVSIVHRPQQEVGPVVDEDTLAESWLCETNSTEATSYGGSEKDIAADSGDEKSASRTRVVPLLSPATPEDTEPKQKQTCSDSSIWFHYFSRIGLPYFFLFVASALAFGVTTTYPTVWLEEWTSDNSKPSPAHSFGWYIGVYAALGVCCLLFSFIMGIVVLVAFVRNSGAALHKQTIRTAMSAAMSYLNQTSSGTLITHFSQDLSIIDGMLAGSLINLTSAVVITLGQAALLVVSSAWLALSFPGLAGVLFFVWKMYVPTALRLRVLDLEAKGPIVTHILSTISGLPTIRAFGWIPGEIERSHSLLDTSQKPSYLLGVTQQWLLLVVNMVMVVLAVMLVCLATLLQLGSGTIGVGLVTLITFGRNAADGIRAYTMVEIALGAIGRLKTFSESTPLETQVQAPRALDKSWPIKGALQIEAVSARYGTLTDSQLALDRLSMSVSPAEKIAICGRTGSGKSSIIMLLLGLLDPTSERVGKVAIDDVYLDQLSRDDLRNRLIVMPQDPVFLPNGTSVRRNLDPTGRASDCICQGALETVGLMLPSLSDLSTDLDTSNLRGIGCDGGLLLLDEVTSHLDDETAGKIDEVIKHEFSNYTVLAVTHRMRNIEQFSKAFVLDAGRVVEAGVVGELLAREDSYLKKLFEMDGQ
ncbi:abc transporter [Colletotrichum tabaci]|uniref:Abc transporter n=1 Tax=Colletotrichum tabaci TaxID=1209068 RepID=A0AAV9TKH6_9PEZI